MPAERPSHPYKAEPCVIAANAYANAPHAGRGGRRWYTGSAGWMQRAGIESIPGLRLDGDAPRSDPCIPRAWPGFEMTVRFRSARYEILVENPDSLSRGVVAATVDGVAIPRKPIDLQMRDDGNTNRVLVRLG